MILIALHHPDGTKHVLPEPLGLVCQGDVRVVTNAMRLDICLVNDVKAVLIAQLIESFRLRVV